MKRLIYMLSLGVVPLFAHTEYPDMTIWSIFCGVFLIYIMPLILLALFVFWLSKKIKNRNIRILAISFMVIFFLIFYQIFLGII